jgi:hypothetical protein
MQRSLQLETNIRCFESVDAVEPTRARHCDATVARPLM